jgi:hypothetical protein
MFSVALPNRVLIAVGNTGRQLLLLHADAIHAPFDRRLLIAGPVVGMPSEPADWTIHYSHRPRVACRRKQALAGADAEVASSEKLEAAPQQCSF